MLSFMVLSLARMTWRTSRPRTTSSLRPTNHLPRRLATMDRLCCRICSPLHNLNLLLWEGLEDLQGLEDQEDQEGLSQHRNRCHCRHRKHRCPQKPLALNYQSSSDSRQDSKHLRLRSSRLHSSKAPSPGMVST